MGRLSAFGAAPHSAIEFVVLWLTPSWYAYLLRRADYPYYAGNWWLTDWARRLWCRMRGHPCGIVFYNAGALEPDYTCKDCGDDLG